MKKIMMTLCSIALVTLIYTTAASAMHRITTTTRAIRQLPTKPTKPIKPIKPIKPLEAMTPRYRAVIEAVTENALKIETQTAADAAKKILAQRKQAEMHPGLRRKMNQASQPPVKPRRVIHSGGVQP